MKIINRKKIYLIGLAVSLFSLPACNSESLISTDGTGIVRMNVSMNSKITRGDISGDELTALQENCVVYISDKIGLLHKWQGVSNIPDQLSMKYDTYVAEAWAGDSVSASFDRKFYKGMTTFTVDEEHQSQNVVINCKIANVIGSVDVTTIDRDLIKDVEITFSNSLASLTLNEENLYNKGYFMMPDGDSILKYKVTGKNINGDPFTKEGEETDVKQGHEYRLQIVADPSQSTSGGAFFDIIIEEFNEQIDDELIIYGKPAFSWYNPALSLDGQIVNTNQTFNSEMLRIAAYNDGFKSLTLETENMSDVIGSKKYDLVNVSEDNLKALSEKGITLTKSSPKDGLYIWCITFESKLLNTLAPSDEEYTLKVTAIDNKNKSNSMDVRIANTEKAISDPDPIVIDVESFTKDQMAVGINSATIPLNIVDNSKDFVLQYREENTENWKEEKIILTKANEVYVTLSNLSPGTTYEYRVITTSDEEGSKTFTSSINKFKTEAKFIIPNASMEEWSNWSSNSKVLIPGAGGNRTFWDTGNHGSTTLNVTLTKNSTEIVGEGTYSAKLRSQMVGITSTIGKFAAGNLFVGEYAETKGTNGVINFGREYNGSHPKAVKLMANYRPGKVEKKVSGQNYLNVGDTDKGQIYIALTSAPVKVDTSDKSTLFSKDFDSVLAYGEVTWDDNFGDDNKLKEVIINFDYKESAKTIAPKYIVIVCSASKFGDYFVGGEGSTMYVDDFELVY